MNKTPPIPINTPLAESSIATTWLDSDGFLISLSKNTQRTIQNIRENKDAISQVSQNRILPIMVYLTRSPMPSKETRDYVNRELANTYKAMAMISKPGLAQLIMSFLFKLKKPPIPIQIFNSEKQARIWLKQFI